MLLVMTAISRNENAFKERKCNCILVPNAYLIYMPLKINKKKRPFSAVCLDYWSQANEAKS
jgi:hypothetical protein